MTGIEVIRGRLDDPTRAALIARGAEPEGVVCVLRGTDGALVGAAAVRAEPFPGIPERQLWRLDVFGAARTRFREVHAVTWRALDADYEGTGPEGLLAFPETPDPELEWAGPRTLLIGYAADGRQARMAPFSAARNRAPSDWPPADPPYRIAEFAEQTQVTADDVIALWLRESGMGETEAKRRVREVLLVATDRSGALAGVATRYLRRNEQLWMDLWYLRVFVAASERRGTMALALMVAARRHLEDGYVSGRDERAPGFVFEVENPELRVALARTVWEAVDVVLVGENPRGEPVRVCYFAGARLP